MHRSIYSKRIDAGSERMDQILSILFSTPMFIGGMLGCLLDNLLPGVIGLC